MTTVAVFQPRLYAYSATAAPSSCAALPNEKASLPAEPKRDGPIWSVPMHGETVSSFACRNTWIAGVA